jgi:hypothetical protein
MIKVEICGRAAQAGALQGVVPADAGAHTPLALIMAEGVSHRAENALPRRVGPGVRRGDSWKSLGKRNYRRNENPSCKVCAPRF